MSGANAARSNHTTAPATSPPGGSANELHIIPHIDPTFPYTHEQFQRDPPRPPHHALPLSSQTTQQVYGQPGAVQRMVPELIDSDSEDDEDETEEDRELRKRDPIEFYSRHLVAVLVPVSITMILVVFYVRSLDVSSGSTTSSTTFVSEDSSSSNSEKLGSAIVNALIFVGMIVGVTVILVVLYIYRCTSLIYAWLILSSLSLLGVFGSYLFIELLDAYNKTIDYYSLGFIAWNFATVGALSIFWKAPMRLNQAYLIIISSLMAWSFTKLPEWTTWAILAAVAIYDLFAVLAPKGPLKVLIETSQERQEPIPGLLYNTYMMWIPVAGGPLVHMDSPVKESGVKLGLGDFVFYSVLVGRAAMYDWSTIVTCFLAILTGLALTLFLLAVFRRALPALPISIALGFLFYFVTRVFIDPFIRELGSKQIFI